MDNRVVKKVQLRDAEMDVIYRKCNTPVPLDAEGDRSEGGPGMNAMVWEFALHLDKEFMNVHLVFYVSKIYQ